MIWILLKVSWALAQGTRLRLGTPQERRWWAQLGILSTMGIAMAISMATGVLGGYFLDKWLGTGIFFWVGLLVGILAAYRTLWVFYTRYLKERGPTDEGSTKR